MKPLDIDAVTYEDYYSRFLKRHGTLLLRSIENRRPGYCGGTGAPLPPRTEFRASWVPPGGHPVHDGHHCQDQDVFRAVQGLDRYLYAAGQSVYEGTKKEGA